MKNLTVHNANYLTFRNDLLSIDVLGGVDLSQVERMVCTLRISYQSFIHRTTLDLYNDTQTERLTRTLCDTWEVKLLDVSKTFYTLTLALEEYRLLELQYKGKVQQTHFTLSTEEKKQALRTLKSKTLIKQLVSKLNQIGVIGENDNALILFLALASHKHYHPFSVLCLAKSGIGKSYILQKLANCMPYGSYSFHTQISANALYYFNSHQIHNKALLIEDLEWTTQMLTPLATLQSQGKLVKTRATKDKDGMLHSTTFEVEANLCLIACAYSERNYQNISLPFLVIHLNHSQQQDIAIMDYQRKVSAGLVNPYDIQKVQHQLKCLIASLTTVKICNPFAPLIQLPEDVAHPRKSLILLLGFIEVITYFFQHQREQTTHQDGEIHIQTHPDDIELAFTLLKNSLFRKADELSTTVRGFYNWLSCFLNQAKTNEFTALDIRQVKTIHPRTLNRYLQELKLYSYIKVVGGNKHREGYRYRLTNFGNQNQKQTRITQALQNNLKLIKEAYQKQTSKTVRQPPMSNPKAQQKPNKNSRTT
ncbi:hypothetical protein [Tenacibaculum maritimum]|uniref:hypothetical protein n=3 Tax=Tenacibaculum maritimum TaxID=107401 RepID=UPI00388F2266